MAPKHKAPAKAETSKSSPRKKVKTSNGAGDGQASLGSFLKTPKKSPGTSITGNGVISLLSDSEAGEGDEVEHVPAVPAKQRAAAPNSEIIDLEDVLSSDSDAEDIKPVAGPSSLKKESNAAVHPLFRKNAIKLEDGEPVAPAANGSSGASSGTDRSVKQEETKPAIDRKGKGKAEITTDSPKKLIFPKTESDEPVSYPLEKDIFEFDPKQDISTDTWPRTQAGKIHIPYSFLVAAFVLISATRSRLIIVTVMTNTLRTIVEYDPEVLKDAVYLVSIATSC